MHTQCQLARQLSRLCCHSLPGWHAHLLHTSADIACWALQEEQKWLAEEKIREQIEKRDDVVKRGHMGDFYR